MRFFCTVLLVIALAGSMAGQTAFSEAQQKFTTELAAKFQTLETKKAAAGPGEEGWLFFAGELRLLSLRFKDHQCLAYRDTGFFLDLIKIQLAAIEQISETGFEPILAGFHAGMIRRA